MPDITPIFLLSLPRSGSTLVQRVLASHPNIVTAAEPWFLLPHLSHLLSEGTCAEYDFETARIAMDEFISKLDGGHDRYRKALRRFSYDIYAGIGGDSTTMVLDKTPRYSLIVEQLHKIFPDAKYLYLWRNPLSIIASSIESWGKEGLWNIHRIHVDLYLGLPRLLESFDGCKESVCSCRYEDLVAQKSEWNKIYDYLGLGWDETALYNIDNRTVSGTMGDKTGLEQYHSLSTESIDRWKEVINTPLRKMWCRRYLRWLGSNRLDAIGYNLEDLINDINGVPNKYLPLPMDFLAISYGFLYGLLELPMLKSQFKKLLNSKKAIAHR